MMELNATSGEVFLCRGVSMAVGESYLYACAELRKLGKVGVAAVVFCGGKRKCRDVSSEAAAALRGPAAADSLHAGCYSS